MIRVAILGSRGLPASYGGFESFVDQLARDIDKEEFTIYVATEKSLKSKEYNISGVNRVFFPVFEKLRIISEALYDVRSLIWAAKAPVDIILLLGYAAVPFCIIPKIFHKTIIIHPDGLEWKRRKFGKGIRMLLKLHERLSMILGDFIVADSKELQRFYLNEYGKKSEFIAYSGNLIMNEQSDKHELLYPKDNYYLVVARLEPENNIDVIINGYVKSGSSKKLVVVGPLPDNPFIKKLKMLAKNNSNVILLGGIYDKKRLISLRLNCFAYLHGHEVGGTNPSLLEALGSGNMVIAKDVAFNREVIGDSGFFFEDDTSLANIIIAADRLPHIEVENRRLYARKIIANRYNNQIVTDAYQSLFKKAYLRQSYGFPMLKVFRKNQKNSF